MVSLIDCLELFRRVVFWVGIGVVLFHKASIGSLDFLGGGIPADAQYFAKVMHRVLKL